MQSCKIMKYQILNVFVALGSFPWFGQNFVLLRISVQYVLWSLLSVFWCSKVSVILALEISRDTWELARGGGRA